MVKFSIITATLNAAATLPASLRSVADQRRSDSEHLIVDGGSTDGTLDAIRAGSSPAVRLVGSEPDNGIYAAFNKGVRGATGEVVAFLNADDTYLPGTLDAVAAAFRDQPGAGLVHGNIQVCRHNGWETLRPPAGRRALGGARIFHPATFVRRELFEQLGGFDEQYRIAGDLDWFLRAQEAGIRFHHLDRPLTRFALGGISTRRGFLATREVCRILRRHALSPPVVLGEWLDGNLRNLLRTVMPPRRGAGIVP